VDYDALRELLRGLAHLRKIAQLSSGVKDNPLRAHLDEGTGMP